MSIVRRAALHDVPRFGGRPVGHDVVNQLRQMQRGEERVVAFVQQFFGAPPAQVDQVFAAQLLDRQRG